MLSLAYSIADQTFIRTKSLGILNLSLQLATVLAARSDLPRLEFFSNTSLRDWHGQFAGRPVRCFDHASATRPGRMLWDQLQVYGEARKQRVDWLFLPKGFASFCRRPPIRIAAYVHDVMEDWYRQRYPGAASGSEAWYFRHGLMATLRQATVVFTNSHFTRSELLAFSARHAIRPPDIVVAGIGFDPVTTPTGRERNGIVVLASPLRHKRTDLAVQYLAAWQRTAAFAGRVDWVGRFPARLPRPSHPRWTYHERMDESAYRQLLAGSQAVLYVSEYEGFGMPPVEAVLHGACPVYSSIPATQEIMQSAGAPFANSSFESFVAAMETALRMQPAEVAIIARGLQMRHDWSAVADRIVGALHSHNQATRLT